MILSMPHIVFSAWLTLFGYQFAVAALSRRKRSHHQNHAANKEDSFSSLPDDILISIIARLPTNEAARTSILSNRWRDLYKFVTDIILRCSDLIGPSLSHPHDLDMIINGVDRFFRLRSGFKIRSIYLRCCLMKLQMDGYEQLLYSLGILSINNLVLLCSCQMNIRDASFSCHLLSQMPSLKHFLLGCCSLHQNCSLTYYDLGLCSLNKSPPWKLTQSNNVLEVLSLWYVSVGVGALECILYNCLSLHSLYIYSCDFSSKLSLRGSNLRLKRILIEFCKGFDEIEFWASNLMTFEFRSNEVVNFVFNHVPQLQNVYLGFPKKDTMFCVCTKINKDLPQLKSLIFETEGDIYPVSWKTMGFNTFGNLRQLSLRLYATYEVDLLLLAPFLQRCPLLEEFHLDTEYVECGGRKAMAPEVIIHRKLKKVDITGHDGTKNEIDFALYILKSAICLEQMQISRRSKRYGGGGRWVGDDGKPSWSKRAHKMIQEKLRNQALSTTARVIVQHSPVYENNWDIFDD